MLHLDIDILFLIGKKANNHQDETHHQTCQPVSGIFFSWLETIEMSDWPGPADQPGEERGDQRGDHHQHGEHSCKHREAQLTHKYSTRYFSIVIPYNNQKHFNKFDSSI